MRAVGGGSERTGGGFELRRSGGYGLDDLADQRFEVARDTIHPASAFDLGVCVTCGGLIGGFLRNQRLLENLQGVCHGADLGRLALVRHLRGQVTVA